MRCYLIRHGQTLWNGQNRIQGQSDQPLSPLGQEQAKRLGVRFAGHHLDGIFTSALQRSRQTAEAIISGNGHEVRPVIDAEWGEMHLGDWEGLTPQEVDHRFANAYQQWRLKPSSVVIPGAEPVDAFRQRVRRAMERLVANRSEGEYAVVSHGGVIASILADFLGADYDQVIRRVRLDNAGVTALEFGSGSPHVVWINSTIHLEALGSAGVTWF